MECSIDCLQIGQLLTPPDVLHSSHMHKCLHGINKIHLLRSMHMQHKIALSASTASEGLLSALESALLEPSVAFDVDEVLASARSNAAVSSVKTVFSDFVSARP